MPLIRQLDHYLLKLAWSLWTELGVAGVHRNHQHILILVEELILFTAALSEIDPRLRDESLDWCLSFDRFISTSRLKSLLSLFGEDIKAPYSMYAATLNNASTTNWPILCETSPLEIRFSGKSVLMPHASAALLNMRARSLFGTGARADLITFFLVHENTDFSISDATEVGYTKRNLTEVLNDLHFGKLLNRSTKRNQLRYRLDRKSPIFDLLQPIPKYVPWCLIFTVLLSIRACIKKTENDSESTQVVAIRNCLDGLRDSLSRLGLTPPPLQNNLPVYLEAFSQWILSWATQLSEGKI